MKLKKRGKSTSEIEINISSFGLWLLVDGQEYYAPYKNYPWFYNAKVSDIYNVELTNKEHLYWPNLDVDINVDCLKHPEKYPLRYK